LRTALGHGTVAPGKREREGRLRFCFELNMEKADGRALLQVWLRGSGGIGSARGNRRAIWLH
jgi:hypothetical protein